MKSYGEFIGAHRSVLSDDKAAKLASASISRPFALGSRIKPEARLARPPVLDPHGATDPCATCDVRALSVCSAIPDADLARLAAITVVTDAPAGQGFIGEGEPAICFFIVNAGTAKLFKLLPDGRRQITGFVGPGEKGDA